MTYFAKFDQGTDHHTETLFSETSPGDGWYELPDADLTGKHYKLVNGVVTAYTDAEVTTFMSQMVSSSGFVDLRIERDKLLTACDWTQSSDAASNVDKAAWAAYRQALRNLPSTVQDPSKVVWPTPPAAIN